MKLPLSILFLLTTVTNLINLPVVASASSSSSSQARNSLRTQTKNNHDETAEVDQEDRDLITYNFNGYKTTRYYNDSYTRTYKSYASKYNKMGDDYDFDFHYNRTHHYYDEEGEDEEETEEEEEDDDAIVDDGSIESKILLIQAQYNEMFQSSPAQWEKNQWILFGALMGSIVAFISISALCCLCCGRTCGATVDKLSGGDDQSTLCDHDEMTTFDDETTVRSNNTFSLTSANASTLVSSSVKQDSDNDMVYVRLNAAETK